MQASATVLIEQYGDSTTSGLTAIDGKVQVAKLSGVDQIYLSLNKRFGAQAAIANKGISQTCAIHLLDGDATTPKWADRVKESKATIVTFNYGMNQCDRTAEQYLGDLQQLVDITLAAGKQVVLIEPNPSTKPEKVILDQYVGAMNLVAEQRKVPIIQHFKIWNQLPNWQSLLSDGIHPTEQGYQIKGLTEYQALAPIIIDDLAQQSTQRP
ncbi:SGNH_hydro domain-containing protein [Pseudomonas chlororaphis]